ncbi:uncharacterized protein LOC115218683 [Octopus sinensis]|uniref:Uncharacterized protein LOC115218683 n=1 Tax=Octopus sinensis TaxID=2607531 RepID=A0A6P7T181_9MOLL|nr:uncharacterized protein LOC115218683 [Octopus sinensis]
MKSGELLPCFIAIFAFLQLMVQAKMLHTFKLDQTGKDSSLFEADHVTYIKVFNASLTVRPLLKIIKAVPVEMCAQKCATTTGCKSFVYHKFALTCFLSKHDASEDGIKVVRRTKYDYFQIIPNKGKMVVVKGATIDKYDHLDKLDDISADRCAAHCKQLKNCKMFEYKVEQRRCDLTDLNHKDKSLTASIHRWDYYSLNDVPSIRMFLRVPDAYLRDGNRFKYIKEYDVETCATTCLLTKNCIAFEHDTKNGPTCILLSDDASKVKIVRPTRNRDFYQLQQERGTMNIILGASINGYDYYPTTRGSLKECLDRCVETKACEAVEYKHSNRKCDIANVTHFDFTLKPSIHYWNFYEINGSQNLKEVKER